MKVILAAAVILGLSRAVAPAAPYHPEAYGYYQGDHVHKTAYGHYRRVTRRVVRRHYRRSHYAYGHYRRVTRRVVRRHYRRGYYY
jgi:hypothetical protein